MKKMPSTYAHYRFGQEVLKELPNDIKKIIIENKDLRKSKALQCRAYFSVNICICGSAG